MIPYAIKRRIIDETSITEVVSEYVQLTKKGKSLFGLCPFHNDNHPSMSVSDDVKMFNCFSCNTKGNVIDFVAKYNNINEDQATIMLAKRLGIEINQKQSAAALRAERLIKIMRDATEFYQFYLYNSNEGTIALNYLYNRGIDDQMIKELKIGLAPKEYNFLQLALAKKNHNILDILNLGLIKENAQGEYYDVFRERIIFPIADHLGQIVGFSGRIYTNSNQAKYINSVENEIFHKGNVLYNYHNAISFVRSDDLVYLFEGFMDVIAAKRAGIHNAVATMGTALTLDHIKMLTSLTKNIVLCFDGDSAGIKAMKRSAFLLAKINLIPNAVVLPESLDPDEFLAKYGKEKLMEFLQQNSKNVYYWLYDLAYQKVLPNDLVSLEEFKKEVFEFIKIASQETIKIFFIKKLATQMDVSYKELLEDYEKYNPSSQYDIETMEQVETIKKPKEEINTVIKKKEVKITKGVIIAYNSILKHAINSKERFAIFFEKSSIIDGDIRYPGAELADQYSIFLEIEKYYSQNERLNAQNLSELLSLDEHLKEVAQKILDDKFIDVTKKENFDECLNTIVQFYKRQDNAIIYNRISAEGINSADELVKARDVKIIRKEDEF